MVIKGETIKLYIQTITGQDAFGADIVTEEAIEIPNVVISPTTQEAIINELQLYGKHSVYTLCIPKDDRNDWDNKTIEFWGKKYRSFGAIEQYMEHMLPLEWNKKVRVELYE
ncbi:MAG: hypothetical protein MJZ34_13580 [Paludibacteraceae bacterium]|nr:hypothetical protein [Paludibacteraceae bacterium]